MEGKEYDIFSELEHELGRDLSQWRRHIVASFEKCCQAAIEMERAKSDPLNLDDPVVYATIKHRTISFLIADWIEDKESPRPRDLISVTGSSYWYTLDETTGNMSPFRLPIGYKMEGPLIRWDVAPYIDEAGLDLDAHLNDELTYRHTRSFGVHLILEHPIITSDAGTLLQVDTDRAYVPIHYARTGLKLYSNE